MALEPYQSVNQTEGPPPRGWCQLFDYDGTDLIYQGWAQSVNELTEWSIDNGGLTSIADSGTTATVTTAANHGLQTGNQIKVSGASDADLDGTYVITVTGATTFTFTSANVTDATYNTSRLRITTQAPRTNRPVWAIKRIFYTSNITTRIGWAEGTPERQTFAWDSRTTYAYQ